MSKGIGRLVALGVTAVFIAFISVIADTAIRTEPVQAHDSGSHFKQWCAIADSSGAITFVKLTTHDPGVGLFSSRKAKEEACEELYDGAWMKTKQKERIEGSAVPGAFTLTSPSAFPAGWFERPSGGECDALPNSGAILGAPGSTLADQNRLQHVNVLKTIELTLQIVYDVGSNEITGITGAILGSLLGVSKVATYVTEWNYDIQDECQEIVERNTIQDINVDTEGIVSDVTTLLVDVATRSSQTSVDALSTDVDAVDAKVIQISTTLAALGASLTTETDEIDAALAALAASLTTETDEIDAALAALNLQLAAAQDQSVRLYIEDHLDSCRPLASLLLSDSAGLLPLTVLVVDDLATRAEAAGLDIGDALRHLDRANDSILAGDAREGFQSLCTAYEQIVRVRGR